MKLKSILFKERAGDPLGSGTDFPDANFAEPLGYGFQGSGKAWATGSGNRSVGAVKTLVDPAEEEKRKVRGPLSDIQNSKQLEEREASDILYRDLPGGLPMNALANPTNHIPREIKDPENKTEENDMDTVSLTTLIPFPKLEKYGYGPLTPTKQKFESINTANSWEETSGENIKTIPNDGKYDVLVAPRDWLSNDELDPLSGFNRLNDEDDVNTRAGDMANLVAAKKHIPEPAPVYEDKMKAKESKKLNDLEKKEDHLPSGAEVKPKKPVGSNLGSVLNNDKAAPKNMKNENKNDEVELTAKERLQPYKGSGEVVVVDPEAFTLVRELVKETVREMMQQSPGISVNPKAGATGRAVERKLDNIPGLENLLNAVRGKADAALILSQIATALGGDKLKGSDALKRALQLTLTGEKQPQQNVTEKKITK